MGCAHNLATVAKKSGKTHNQISRAAAKWLNTTEVFMVNLDLENNCRARKARRKALGVTWHMSSYEATANIRCQTVTGVPESSFRTVCKDGLSNGKK